MSITFSAFLLMSESSLNAKSAQYELVLSAGINRIAFDQIQTNQDKRKLSRLSFLAVTMG